VTPLRYVHVGLGGWGQHWCEVTLPYLRSSGLAEPVAVVDTDKTRFGVAIENLGVAPDQCYTSVTDALKAHDSDFVTVVVPPAFHEEVIDTAVEHDQHILCEKPMADSLDACVRISDKVTRAGLKMAVTMSHRFDQDKQTLEAAVHSGDYGRLNYVVVRFTCNNRAFGSWGDFRHLMADPLLVEGAVHQFDILRAITGSDAKTVYATTWNPPWGQYAGDSTGLVTIEMTNGVRCLYEGAKANASTLNGWTHDYIRAECEHATLELSHRRLQAITSGPDGLLTRQHLPMRTDGPAWRNEAIAADFCGWLRGGPAPATNHLDNLQCSALLFSALASAHTGRQIDVQQALADATTDLRAT
jgi:predicted dehydrogenase